VLSFNPSEYPVFSKGAVVNRPMAIDDEDLDDLCNIVINLPLVSFPYFLMDNYHNSKMRCLDSLFIFG